MQPDPYHAVPEEKRNTNGFRILPSGALVTDTPPFDHLFEEGTECKISYHEKEVTLNRLKLAKRDGTGTKYRG